MDASESSLVSHCGSVSSKKECANRLNFTAFYEALREAKGVSLRRDTAGRGKGAGNVFVGKSYTAMLDLQPGDEFEIKLARKQIKPGPAGYLEEALSTGLGCPAALMLLKRSAVG